MRDRVRARAIALVSDLSDQTEGGVLARPRRAVPLSVPGVIVRMQRVTAGAQDRLKRLTAPLDEQAARVVGNFRRRFHSPLHSEWLAAVMGIALGVSFSVCFLTGMVDYLAQNPPLVSSPSASGQPVPGHEERSRPDGDRRHSVVWPTLGRLSNLFSYRRSAASPMR